MAGSEVWGTPAGDIAYDQNELTRAKTLETLSDVAAAPSKRRLAEAQAAKLEEEVASECRLSALATEMRLFTNGQAGAAVAGKPKSMADQLDSLARGAMGAGMVTKGTALAKDAALVRQRDAAQYSSAVQAKLNALKGVRERAELEGQLFGGVDGEESWAQANALMEFQTGQPSPYAGLKYSPELVQRLNQAALSAKERADLEERKVTREATATYRTRRLGQIDEQNVLRKKRNQIAAAREARLAKAGGGKGVGTPTSAELSQIKTLIGKDFPGDSISAEDKEDAAFQIAAEAKALKLANPALTIAMAIQQAYIAAKDAGDFTEDSGWLGTGLKAKTKFSGIGRTAAVPVPIPFGPEGAEAAAKLPVGRYVQNPNGVRGVTTKTGVRPLSPDNSRPDDEAADSELDDDEDD